MSPSPGGCRRGGVRELPGLSRLPLTVALPVGLPVQPLLMARREEGWIRLPASLPALRPPCPEPLGLTLAAFPARSQAFFSSIP